MKLSQFIKGSLLLLYLTVFEISAIASPIYVDSSHVKLVDYSALVSAVMPAVVNISAVNSEKETSTNNIGSGFIISQDGYVVTSYHIIKGFNGIKIVDLNKKEYDTEMIGFDEKTDIALLKINSKESFIYVEMSPDIKIGEGVLVIGNPFGLEHSVTAGIISAKSRFLGKDSDEFIQTDAAINYGNSGGPWFNSSGKVVGISSVIVAAKTDGGNVGIGLAVPADIAIKVIEKIKNHTKIVRPWIGISYMPVDKDISLAVQMTSITGVFIYEVLPNSPAEKANLHPRDILLKINDIELKNDVSIPKIISDIPINTKIELEILRSGKKIKTYIVLQEKQDGELKQDKDLFGIEVNGISRILRHKLSLPADFKGVAIANIFNKKVIESGKLYKNDIIVQINDKKIKNVMDFKSAMKFIKHKKHKIALFYLYKKGKSFAVPITLE